MKLLQVSPGVLAGGSSSGFTICPVHLTAASGHPLPPAPRKHTASLVSAAERQEGCLTVSGMRLRRGGFQDLEPVRELM